MKNKFVVALMGLSALIVNAHVAKAASVLSSEGKNASGMVVVKRDKNAGKDVKKDERLKQKQSDEVVLSRVKQIVFNASGYHPKTVKKVTDDLYVASIPFPQKFDGNEHYITVFVYPEKDLVIFGDGVVAKDNAERISLTAQGAESLIALSVADAIKNTIKEMNKGNGGNTLSNQNGFKKGDTKLSSSKGNVAHYRDKVLKMLGLSEKDVIPAKDGKEGYSLVIIDSDCPWSRKMLKMMKEEWNNIKNKVDIVAIPAVGDGVIDALSYQVWKKYQDGQKAFETLLDDGVMAKHANENEVKNTVEIMNKISKNGVQQTPTIINVQPDGSIKVIEDYRDKEAVKKSLGIKK